jgi:hypothetical protein
LDDVTALVHELGGTASGEHGDGRLRAPLLPRLYGPAIVELFGNVKRAFDPAGILNPGVILPVELGERDQFKVGRGAPPIPPDIEAALRNVERSGGWSVPKTDLALGTDNASEA